MAFNQASIGRGSSRACPSGWQDDPGNCRDRPCVSKEARHACAIGLHPGQKTYYANQLIMMLILNNIGISHTYISAHIVDFVCRHINISTHMFDMVLPPLRQEDVRVASPGASFSKFQQLDQKIF